MIPELNESNIGQALLDRTDSRKQYEAYLKSERWRQLRMERLRMNLWWDQHVMCNGCKCFVFYTLTEIHHKTYERRGREQLEDLVVLCSGCHSFYHGYPTPMWWRELRADHRLSCWTTRDLQTVANQIARSDSNISAREAIYLAIPLVAPIVRFQDTRMRDCAQLMSDWLGL